MIVRKIERERERDGQIKSIRGGWRMGMRREKVVRDFYGWALM